MTIGSKLSMVLWKATHWCGAVFMRCSQWHVPWQCRAGGPTERNGQNAHVVSLSMCIRFARQPRLSTLLEGRIALRCVPYASLLSSKHRKKRSHNLNRMAHTTCVSRYASQTHVPAAYAFQSIDLHYSISVFTCAGHVHLPCASIRVMRTTSTTRSYVPTTQVGPPRARGSSATTACGRAPQRAHSNSATGGPRPV